MEGGLGRDDGRGTRKSGWKGTRKSGMEGGLGRVEWKGD